MGISIDYTGKTVLVTGAGRGLGKAMALTFAKAGADVYPINKLFFDTKSFARLRLEAALTDAGLSEKFCFATMMDLAYEVPICMEEVMDEYADLPGMADVDFSLLLFCREIRKEVKMALSGECADEIFGGYPWYRDPEVRAQSGFPWAQNTRARIGMLASPLLSNFDPESFVMDAYEDTVRKSDVLPGTSPLERRMKEMVNLNFRWFMQTLLDRKDRMSMYSGLEVRVPFCDYRIAEYLYTLPWEYKDWQGREKGLLREAVKGLLPESVRMRKKSPYPKTFDPRYEQIMARRVQALLNEKNAPVFEIIRRDAMEQLLSAESAWPWYGQLMRRPQTLAYFLQLNFWLRYYQVELLF